MRMQLCDVAQIDCRISFFMTDSYLFSNVFDESDNFKRTFSFPDCRLLCCNATNMSL